MSVVVARGSELCDRCVLAARPWRWMTIEQEWSYHGGALRVYIETADLCERCSDHVVVRDAYPSEHKIILHVIKKSPALRRQRRAAFWRGIWRDLKDPYVHLLIICALLAWALMTLAVVAAWSVSR